MKCPKCESIRIISYNMPKSTVYKCQNCGNKEEVDNTPYESRYPQEILGCQIWYKYKGSELTDGKGYSIKVQKETKGFVKVADLQNIPEDDNKLKEALTDILEDAWYLLQTSINKSKLFEAEQTQYEMKFKRIQKEFDLTF